MTGRKNKDLLSYRKEQFRIFMLNMIGTDLSKKVDNAFKAAHSTFLHTNNDADFEGLIKCLAPDVLIELAKTYLDKGQVYAARSILTYGLYILDYGKDV